MLTEKYLDDFLNDKTDDLEPVINELSLYVSKVFYKSNIFSEIGEIKSELYIFLTQKKPIFLKYKPPRWDIIKKSAVNYFYDILKKKHIQLVLTEEKDLVQFLDNTSLHHIELSYITKLKALETFDKFKNEFTEKEQSVLFDIIEPMHLDYTSKTAEYKAKERVKKKLKDVILKLNLDYETTDILLDIFINQMKSKKVKKSR